MLLLQLLRTSQNARLTHLWLKRSKVKVTKPINANIEMYHIFGMGRPTNFKLCTPMEHTDLHHRRVQTL